MLPSLALGAYVAACLLLWAEETWRPEWDSALYLLTGGSLAAGEGYVYQGTPFFLRPPGFAWWLSHWASDGTYDMARVVTMMMACAGAAVVAIHVALRTVVGRWTALAVALLSGTSPLFVHNFNWVLSEFPFLVLVFLGLACAQRSARRERRWYLWAVAGALLLGASLWVRSVALLLLPGLALLGARSDRGRARWRPWLLVALVLAAGAPWMHHAATAREAATSPSEQLLLFDYSTALLRVDPGDPASERVPAELWKKRIERSLPRLSEELSASVLHTRQPVASLALAVLVLLGCALCIARRPSIFEWFFLAYVALVLAYFTFAERLVMPLVPWVYLYVFAGAVELARRAGRRWRPASALAPVVFLALLALNLAHLPRHLDVGAVSVEGSPIETNRSSDWQDLFAAARWIRENTEEDAILLCNQAPQLAFLTGRTTFTTRFRRLPGLLERTRADYVVVDTLIPEGIRRRASERARRRWVIPGGSGKRRMIVFDLRAP